VVALCTDEFELEAFEAQKAFPKLDAEALFFISISFFACWSGRLTFIPGVVPYATCYFGAPWRINLFTALGSGESRLRRDAFIVEVVPQATWYLGTPWWINLVTALPMVVSLLNRYTFIVVVVPCATFYFGAPRWVNLFTALGSVSTVSHLFGFR
jgi:hypothetical protein